MRYNVSIDVGGTFTDCIFLDNEGQYDLCKVPTTPSSPIHGIMNVLKDVAENKLGTTLETFLVNCDTIIVGSTVATNAVLQSMGAKCAMITTKGFRDILEMRPIVKKEVYNFRLPKPRALIPRYLRFAVEERTLVNGDIHIPLNKKEAREAVRKAKANQCDVVVVCFLHSYVNSSNEENMAKIIKEEYPEAKVVLSSKVLSRPPEYDRFSTAALSGYIHPICESFLEMLEDSLKAAGYKGTLLITTSNAGVTSIEQAIEQPVKLLASGPAAGVLAGSFLGKLVGIDDVITGDMGGTSYDVSILPNGRILTTNESMVGDQKNAAHIVDVRSIGAGGGSIAYLDSRGILCVGPESAAADPGPACYDKGGMKPTVTDADVLLGYVPFDYFLGGQLKLNISLAEEAMRKSIADPLKLDLYEAAYSVYSIVNASMANEMFLTCVSLGYDPREYIFCTAGGGGATHGFDIAARLGIKTIYIPKAASVFCAFGMLAGADFKYEFSHALTRLENQLDLNQVSDIYRGMEKQGVNLLKRIKGIDDNSIKIRRGADVRYFAQAYDIEAWMPESGPWKNLTDEDLKKLINNFHDRHEEIYGHADRTMIAGTTSLKLIAKGVRQKMSVAEQAKLSSDASKAFKRTRPVYFKGLEGFTNTICYEGDKLHHGNIIKGPAIIEEKATTVVVPPKAVVTVDRWGNYIGKLP